MKHLLIVIVALPVIVYAAQLKVLRVRSDLVAKRFNTITSEYSDRPTFVEVAFTRTGKEVLSVQINPYKGDALYVMFLKKNVPEYLKAIDKYLEWAALARERKDAFTKEIAVVPTAQGVSLKFTFHSGNESAHFLNINLRSGGLVKIDVPELAEVYDEANAKKLRDMLKAFADGKLAPSTDIDSIYK